MNATKTSKSWQCFPWNYVFIFLLNIKSRNHSNSVGYEWYDGKPFGLYGAPWRPVFESLFCYMLESATFFHFIKFLWNCILYERAMTKPGWLGFSLTHPVCMYVCMFYTRVHAVVNLSDYVDVSTAHVISRIATAYTLYSSSWRRITKINAFACSKQLGFSFTLYIDRQQKHG